MPLWSKIVFVVVALIAVATKVIVTVSQFKDELTGVKADVDLAERTIILERDKLAERIDRMEDYIKLLEKRINNLTHCIPYESPLNIISREPKYVTEFKDYCRGKGIELKIDFDPAKMQNNVWLKKRDMEIFTVADSDPSKMVPELFRLIKRVWEKEDE